MRFIRFLCLSAIALCSLSSSHAQLTIDRCRQLATEHYPETSRYGLVENTMAYNLSNASKAWLPQGSLSAQATWQNDVMALPDALTGMLASQGTVYPGLRKDQYRIGADLSQQIWDGGRTAASKQAISTAAEVDKNRIDLALYDVQGRVEEIYFSILLLDERIEATELTQRLVDSTLARVRVMEANGVATRSDCDQIEARRLTLGQQKARLEKMRSSYRHVLGLFIGEDINSQTLTRPEAAEFAPDPVAGPQMKLFNSQLNAIGSQEKNVKLSSMPVIGAFVSAYYGYPGYNYFKSMQSRDMTFNLMAGVKVSWNFGSLYTRGNSLRKLAVERESVEAARNTYLFNKSLAETEAEGNIAALKEVMKDDERIVELRASVREAAQSQLRNGVIDATSLLDKITDEELAINDRAAHRIELLQSLCQLKHIRNK